MDKEKEYSDNLSIPIKHHNYIVLLLIILSVILSVIYRFIQDDAFITFIYSRNLVRGEGLTWFGNYVEGYTNFLWVIWIAVGFILNLEPILWSYISGILFFILAIYFTWKVSLKIFSSFFPSILCMLLLITNYTMISYATSGMETMMQTFFLILLIFYFFKLYDNGIKIKNIYLLISVFSSLAILTRMDSVIPVSIIYIFVLIDFIKSRKKFQEYIYIYIPLILITGIWFGWKIYYYGNIFPNSYYVKLGKITLIQTIGIKYIYKFFQWYLIWPFIVIGIISHFFMKKFDRRLIPIILIVIVWTMYIYYIGGDFMEFRFFVPILPLIFLIVTYSIFNFTINSSKKIKIVFVTISSVVLILSSILHSMNFKGISEDNCLDSIEALGNFYGYYTDNNWDRIGGALKNEFKNKNVTIAVGPVGAIVYYSEIKTIDMLGLNNKNINGNYKLKTEGYKRPGHKLIVKMEYLIDKKVNFIIGHPYIALKGTLSTPGIEAELIKWLENIFRETKFPFNKLTFIGIPIDDKEILIMSYLTKTSELDELIHGKNYEYKTVFIK